MNIEELEFEKYFDVENIVGNKKIRSMKEVLYGESVFTVFESGIDKIHCECQLEYRSVINQIKIYKGKWKQRINKNSGISTHTLIVRNNTGNPLFYFTMYENCRRNVSTGITRKDKILHVQFNPSHWMYLTGMKGTEKHKNYIPANSQALALATAHLNLLFATDEFKYLKSLDHESLHSSQFGLNRLDGARDIHACPYLPTDESGFSHDTDWIWKDEFETQADWEEAQCHQILGCFLNSSVAWVCQYEPLKTSHRHTAQTYIKNLKKKGGTKAGYGEILKEYNAMTVNGENPLGASYDYVRRGVRARQDVFYIKKRFDPNESVKDRFIAAPLRFEVRMLNRKEIRTALGISSLSELQPVLEEVEAWHLAGRIGPVPPLEHALNVRLQKWGTPAGEAVNFLKKKKFPKPTKNSIELLLQLEKAEYETHRRLSKLEGKSYQRHSSLPERFKQKTKGPKPLPRQTIEQAHLEVLDCIRDNFKIRQPLDFAAKEYALSLLNTAIAGLGPNTVHLIAGRITGHLDADNQPTGNASARRAYKRLMGWVAFFCEFYGGSHLGFSKFEHRQHAIEILTMREAATTFTEIEPLYIENTEDLALRVMSSYDKPNFDVVRPDDYEISDPDELLIQTIATHRYEAPEF